MPDSMPDRLQVAVAQIETAFANPAANARKHLDFIRQAREAKADVLLFPELSLAGHGAGTETLRLALSTDDPLIGELAAAAGPMRTVFGFIEEGPGAQFYNVAAAVRDNRLEFLHRKINLATYGRLEEGKHYAAGDRVATFALASQWRAGLLICADLWNPPLVHIAAARGATLMLAPISSAVEAVGTAFDNPGGWDVNLRFYAMTYGLPVAMANRVGREGDLTFWGGSRILDAFGRTVAQAEGTDEQLVTGSIDYADVRRARYLLPTLRDANPRLLRDEFDRLVTAEPAWGKATWRA
jgi:predicted amidohydrolase